jgi:hypothetical protein
MYFWEVGRKSTPKITTKQIRAGTSDVAGIEIKFHETEQESE